MKLYFKGEVEVRAYLGIVCSIQLIGSRLPTKVRFSCLGDICLVGNLRLKANAGDSG